MRKGTSAKYAAGHMLYPGDASVSRTAENTGGSIIRTSFFIKG